MSPSCRRSRIAQQCVTCLPLRRGTRLLKGTTLRVLSVALEPQSQEPKETCTFVCWRKCSSCRHTIWSYIADWFRLLHIFSYYQGFLLCFLHGWQSSLEPSDDDPWRFPVLYSERFGYIQRKSHSSGPATSAEERCLVQPSPEHLEVLLP